MPGDPRIQIPPQVFWTIEWFVRAYRMAVYRLVGGIWLLCIVGLVAVLAGELADFANGTSPYRTQLDGYSILLSVGILTAVGFVADIIRRRLRAK